MALPKKEREFIKKLTGSKTVPIRYNKIPENHMHSKKLDAFVFNM